MPNKDKDLVLYLPLDEIHNDGKVPDASGLGNHGAVKGNVTLVPDDTFGACANFGEGQSSYIEVPGSDSLQKLGDFTIEAWVYIAKAPPPQQAVVLIEQGFLWGDYYNVTYNDRWILLSGLAGRTAVPTPPLNTWFHLAGVYRGETLLLVIHDLQGSLLKQADEHMRGDLLPSAFTTPSTTSLHLGFGGTFGGNYAVPHVGKLANFRAYKRALTLAEIERDVRADCMSLLAFRKSHPVDFRLYDDDEQAVLYIGDDAAGHNLHLELRNTSPQTLQLSDGRNAAASEKNHHFALRFRPGTLSDSALKLLINPQERAKLLKQADQQADQWDLYFQPILPAANETASLYLLYKGGELSFLPNERRALTLHRMSAAPGSGARGTQVELIPRQLTAAGGDSTPVTGSRTQYVHVTNHRGKKNIPLHVGFVGSNTVLNDGSGNTLKLRITNVLREGDIKLEGKSGGAPTEFVISFDAKSQKQDKEWALTSTGDATAMTVKVAGVEATPKGGEGDTPEWSVMFDAPVLLAPGKYLPVEIGGLVTTCPSGQANLYVRYKNILGYWDGQFVCAVEKGPVVYHEGRVGIGTRPSIYSDAKLEVAGDVAVNNLTLAPVNERRGGLFLATKGDFNHAIYNNLSNIDQGGAWDGASWNTGHGLRVRVGAASLNKLALVINEKGYVGIGATGPDHQFDVGSSTPIKLGLEGMGGGRLLITNVANDNKINLQAVSSNGQGHAAELTLSGKDGGPVPKLTLHADETHVSGNLSLSAGRTVTFKGCTVVGLPTVAVQEYRVGGETVSNGEYNGRAVVTFPADIISVYPIVAATKSVFLDGHGDRKQFEYEGQTVIIKRMAGREASFDVRVWRQYANPASTPKQLLTVDIVFIAILQGT